MHSTDGDGNEYGTMIGCHECGEVCLGLKDCIGIKCHEQQAWCYFMSSLKLSTGCPDKTWTYYWDTGSEAVADKVLNSYSHLLPHGWGVSDTNKPMHARGIAVLRDSVKSSSSTESITTTTTTDTLGSPLEFRSRAGSSVSVGVDLPKKPGIYRSPCRGYDNLVCETDEYMDEYICSTCYGEGKPCCPDIYSKSIWTAITTKLGACPWEFELNWFRITPWCRPDLTTPRTTPRTTLPPFTTRPGTTMTTPTTTILTATTSGTTILVLTTTSTTTQACPCEKDPTCSIDPPRPGFLGGRRLITHGTLISPEIYDYVVFVEICDTNPLANPNKCRVCTGIVHGDALLTANHCCTKYARFGCWGMGGENRNRWTGCVYSGTKLIARLSTLSAANPQPYQQWRPRDMAIFKLDRTVITHKSFRLSLKSPEVDAQVFGAGYAGHQNNLRRGLFRITYLNYPNDPDTRPDIGFDGVEAIARGVPDQGQIVEGDSEHGDSGGPWFTKQEGFDSIFGILSGGSDGYSWIATFDHNEWARHALHIAGFPFEN